jgi:thiamine-monophosphate kinase
MTTHQLLGPGPEFDRIRAVLSALGEAAAPSGDDCALIPFGGKMLAVSTDAAIEGVHFRTDWLTLEEIGRRSTAAALSDLAAEGATPSGVLVALGVPPQATDAEVAAVMRGAGEATSELSAQVVGGDLTQAPVWMVTVTVFGEVVRPVTRGGGRPGDILYVTGELGGAGVALRAWLSGQRPPDAARLRFSHPQPRIAAGRALAVVATAMMDLSDGIAADLRHLAAASHCGAEIDLDRLPLAPDATPMAAAEGGEDYELLVALPPDAEVPILDVRLTPIGRLTEGDEVRFLLAGAPVSPKGFQHFR